MSPFTQFIAGGASSHGPSASAVNIVAGLLVLAWIMYGQVRRKPLGAKTRLGLILAAPGLGSVSLLLYFGVVIFAQRLVVLGRARARGLVPPVATGMRA